MTHAFPISKNIKLRFNEPKRVAQDFPLYLLTLILHF